MKTPHKKDLLRLQAQYKTDKKIGEALGNVPEYLVNYWRRKKKIPAYSAPKFSRQEIEEAWLRHGNDFRAGRELNLSKAAYYSWRRKYELFEKPAHLKLEQLELSFSPAHRSGVLPTADGATATKKIRRRVRENSLGETPTPEWVLTNHHGDAANRLFKITPGATNPEVMPPPQYVETVLTRPAPGHSLWGNRDFGRVDWQLIEGRVVRPGETIVGDIIELGGLGGVSALCLSSDPGRTGPVGKVEFARHAGPKADVEDRFLEFIEHYPPSRWSDTTLEFLGLAVERMSVDRKIKLAQLATSFGAAGAFCPFDEVIRRHYPRDLKTRIMKAYPDRGAVYDDEYLLEGRLKDVRLAEYVGSWRVVAGLDVIGLPVTTIVIGPDALPYELAYAAESLAGRRIPLGTSLIVLPISAETLGESRRRGWLENLIYAGASVADPRTVARAGLPTLIGDGGDILFTRPPQKVEELVQSSRRLWFSGVRTAAASALRGKITLP